MRGVSKRLVALSLIESTRPNASPRHTRLVISRHANDRIRRSEVCRKRDDVCGTSERWEVSRHDGRLAHLAVSFAAVVRCVSSIEKHTIDSNYVVKREEEEEEDARVERAPFLRLSLSVFLFVILDTPTASLLSRSTFKVT